MFHEFDNDFTDRSDELRILHSARNTSKHSLSPLTTQFSGEINNITSRATCSRSKISTRTDESVHAGLLRKRKRHLCSHPCSLVSVHGATNNYIRPNTYDNRNYRLGLNSMYDDSRTLIP